jgi:anti-anti-sigma regulatory factor
MELPILELKAPWPLLNVEEEDCELVVNFHPEAFLWPAVEEVGITLLCLVDETDGEQLILDFGNVDRVTGVGLQKLVRLSKKLQTNGRRLRIKNVGQGLIADLAGQGLTGEYVIAANKAHRLTV